MGLLAVREADCAAATAAAVAAAVEVTGCGVGVAATRVGSVAGLEGAEPGVGVLEGLVWALGRRAMIGCVFVSLSFMAASSSSGQQILQEQLSESPSGSVANQSRCG